MENDMNIISASFELTATIGAKGIRNEIEYYCSKFNLDCNISERGSWFESQYHVKLKGERHLIEHLIKELNRLAKK